MEFCWKNHQRFCPRCRTRKLYRLASGRRRCGRCAYTFHDFSRRFLNIGGLTCRQWLWLIKFFELETPAATVATQLGLSYNTAYKALSTLRLAILANGLDARVLSEEWRPGDSHSPVFGIVEQPGWVFVDTLPGLTPESVIHFKLNFHLDTAKIGSVVYTAPYRHYACMVFAGGGGDRYVHHNARGLAVDSSEGFWPFARERLARLRGVSSGRFPLYLKEYEFRYNHRRDDIFPILAGYLSGFVPDLWQAPAF